MIDIQNNYDHSTLIADMLAKALSQVDGKNTNLVKLIKESGVSEDPERSADSACKLICFFIELVSKGIYGDDFIEFIKKAVNDGSLRGKDFWLNETQTQMIKHYSDTAFVVEVNSFDKYMELLSIKRIIGTVRILTGKNSEGKDTKHSIISYCDPGSAIPVISDTGKRGIKERVSKHIDKNNFLYFTYIEVG